MQSLKLQRTAALHPAGANFVVAPGADAPWLFTFQSGLSAWALLPSGPVARALGPAAFGLPQDFVSSTGAAFLEEGASIPSVLVLRKARSTVGPAVALVRFERGGARATPADAGAVPCSLDSLTWDALRRRPVCFERASVPVARELVDGTWSEIPLALPGGGPSELWTVGGASYAPSLGRSVLVYRLYTPGVAVESWRAATWDGAEARPLPAPSFLDGQAGVQVRVVQLPGGGADVAVFSQSGYAPPALHVLRGDAWTARPAPPGLRGLFANAAQQLSHDGTLLLASALSGMQPTPAASWDGEALVERAAAFNAARAMYSGERSALATYGWSVKVLPSAGAPRTFELVGAGNAPFAPTADGFVGVLDARVVHVDERGLRTDLAPGAPPYEFALAVATSGADFAFHAVGQSGAKKKVVVYDCALVDGAWSPRPLALDGAIDRYVVTARTPDGFAILHAGKDKPITPTLWLVRGGEVEAFALDVPGYRQPRFRSTGGAAALFFDAPTGRLYAVLVGKDGPVLAAHAGGGRFAIVAELDMDAAPDPSEPDPWAHVRLATFAYRASDRTLVGEGPVDDRSGAVYAFEAPLGALLDAVTLDAAPAAPAVASAVPVKAARKKPTTK